MSKKLNPDITPVDVGTEEMTEVLIYPLSIKDHTEKLPQLLADAYEAFRSEFETLTDLKKISNEDSVKIMEKFKNILYDNLEAILVLVTKEEGRPKPENMTSNQLFTILETIFVVNYEGVLKNSISLFKRVQALKNL